jgi:hypothetical protein
MTAPNKAAGEPHPYEAMEPPIPPDVVGESDEQRWRKAQTLASNTFGLPPNDPLVVQTTRMIYNDRETYTD